MDPADAGPESRERAGASPVSGDSRSDRADDSETTASGASEDLCDEYPTFDDLLPDPASMRASGAEDATDFFRDVWGDTPMRWRVPPETLRSLRMGFRNGDVAKLVELDCRDESNDEYDKHDVSEMLDRTKPPLRHTLNLPFCFAPGAHALRNSVLRMAYNAPTLAEDECEGRIYSDDADEADETSATSSDHNTKSSSAAETRLRFANDVDVGVYASPEGGVEASWHYDANHNVTVQLYGEKTWHVTPGSKGGDRNVNASRGYHDLRRNGREAGDAFYDEIEKVFTLAPGDAIYVPPGTWHKVVPKSAERPDAKNIGIGGGVASAVCLSVDVRVANVPRVRWTCESLFHAMFARGVFGKRDCVRSYGDMEQPKPRASMDSARALGDGAPGKGGVVTQASANEEALSYLTNEPFWYPPRLAPYQPEMSQGADLCAELGFLADAFEGKDAWRRTMERAGKYAADALITWHPMVAASVDFSDERPAHAAFLCSASTSEDSEELPCVLHLRAVSGLTDMEYARLSIVVPRCVLPSCMNLAQLNGVFPEADAEKRKLSNVFLFMFNDFDDAGRHASEDLLDVLTWCRYLRLTPPARTRGAKRQRRDAD